MQLAVLGWLHMLVEGEKADVKSKKDAFGMGIM